MEFPGFFVPQKKSFNLEFTECPHLPTLVNKSFPNKQTSKSPSNYCSTLQNLDNNPSTVFPSIVQTPGKCVLNDKYFKKHEQKTEQYSLTPKISPRKPYGKIINLEVVKEMESKHKENLNQKKNKRFHTQSFDLTAFNSSDYVKEFLTKCQESTIKEKKKTILEQSIIDEQSFEKFINHFYLTKISKSSLTAYFQGHNLEALTNRIGKYLFSNIVISKEQNLALCEYLSTMHKSLKIDSEDYNTYKGLFLISMRQMGFAESEVQRIGEKLESYRPYIVRPLTLEGISCKKESFNEFLARLHQKIMGNGMLTYFFKDSSKETSIAKYRKLFQHLFLGYDNFKQVEQKQEFLNFMFESQDFSWQQCHELKNIIRNELIDGKTLYFNETFNNFDEKLQNLHKFLLHEPNPYEWRLLEGGSSDTSYLINLFGYALNNKKSLDKLFGSWPVNRMQDHSKYMLEYLFNSPKNPYKPCDLTPAHCGSFITKKEFNEVSECLFTSLERMHCPKSDIQRISLNLEKSRRWISRELPIHVKKQEISSQVDQFVENLYFDMFAENATKCFFVNSDLEYVKYKQKLFFMKLFTNELEPVDLIDLKAIHAKMKINPKIFELFVKFSRNSLLETQQMCPFGVKKMVEKIASLQEFICIE